MRWYVQPTEYESPDPGWPTSVGLILAFWAFLMLLLVLLWH